MPRMNGIEFLRELRGDPDLKATAVVVVTISEDMRDQIEAQKLDVAAYVIKPVTFTKLVDVMGKLNKSWTIVASP